MDEIKCIGCGVKIQTTNQNELGYAPPKSIQRESVVCQRCFRLKNYNEIQDVSLTDDDFLKILHNIGNEKALIVKIIDIFDFNGSWINGIHRFAGANPVLLVANKVDVLPKSVNKQKLVDWIRRESKKNGLKPIDVYLASSSKGMGIKEVASAIEHYRDGKDVYVVGCTNVGKSTFINRIIKEVAGEEDIITTSHYPGTTLDLIDIPLSDGSSLYDTPGIIHQHQMAHFVSKDHLKFITPKKELKPRTFQLNEGQTLFFGGLARFDYLKEGKVSFTCYIPNELLIHRTKTEKAEKIFSDHHGDLLHPPLSIDGVEDTELVAHQFTINNKNTDVIFSGLGWVTVNQANAKVVAYAPKGVLVSVRESLI
ncbi:ribosome biogenesis GTPase YqeH [Bacillus carboniphilus]|uniref:Ribosome biogenesis GTPase YqeH n=1 Tax=Bacillus carboniphilus TaxID=86663 RepID=A0ABY9JX97_9BACI|nr:ribosome biogenesis GTPase YqeH [Bacillus carboniphilus]WLR44016.1 ribosome biogenesis GTPase YqeH [Bacillus carboniphilus]